LGAVIGIQGRKEGRNRSAGDLSKLSGEEKVF
jgi:hypothetical protein